MLMANMGVPMLFVDFPVLLAALVPVICLEMLIYHSRLFVDWRQAAWGALRANLWSTLLGIPVAWYVHFKCAAYVSNPMWEWSWIRDTPFGEAVYFVTNSAWLTWHLDDRDSLWMIPTASLILLVPFCLISIGMEQWFLRRYWRDVSGRKVMIAAILANASSYLLLAGYWGVRLIADTNFFQK